MSQGRKSGGGQDVSKVHEMIRAVGQEARDPDGGRALRGHPGMIRGILLEEMAWDVLSGLEPRLHLDPEGHFSTITGFSVVDDSHAEMMASFGYHPSPEMLPPLQRETVSPSIPPDRWRKFLDEDEEALGLLASLQDLIDSADAPPDFRLPLEDRREAKGERTEDPVLSERVRRLTWLLISRDERAMELLSRLCVRRRMFVWGSEDGPWARR